MINKIKALGLAFVAIAALSAVAASGAQAASSFDVGASPAVFTGVGETGQETVLTVKSTSGTTTLNAKCTTASFEGTTQGQNVTEATVTATYGTGKGEFSEAQGCTVGGIKSQVIMNGCKYTITSTATAKTANVDITGCTEGKQIEIKVAAGGCALKIPQQTGLASLVGSNLTAQEVTITGKVSGIKVEQGGGASCPDGATAHVGTNGSFTSNTILKGFQDLGTKQVTKHGHQYTEHLCGTQVSISAT